MIFYGWRKKTLFLAQMPMQFCVRCGTPNSLQLFLDYKSVHLYWIFGVVTSRKYISQCIACRSQALLPENEAAPLVTANPVPFMERWGLAVLAASLVLIAVLAGAQH